MVTNSERSGAFAASTLINGFNDRVGFRRRRSGEPAVGASASRSWPVRGHFRAPGTLCVVCTVGDGVLVVLIYAAGWLAFGRQDWFENPGPAEYAVMLTLGASAAIIVEWRALSRGRWRYSARMPLIPGVRVGLTPVLQMIVLPPVIFYLVAALRHG
ncbi:MAG: hypothetical protein H0W53_16705 [Acidobacteria bacterium]|nr:hypothetical protein [Acidobacteriota bacterium]